MFYVISAYNHTTSILHFLITNTKYFISQYQIAFRNWNLVLLVSSFICMGCSIHLFIMYTGCDHIDCVHGECSMAHTGWECTCEDGYEGVYCAVNINECSQHQCQNDATCVDGLAEYSCNCTDGWKGTFLKKCFKKM